MSTRAASSQLEGSNLLQLVGFRELVHTNVLRSSGSTIGELWKNVKNYVHSTGSTARLLSQSWNISRIRFSLRLSVRTHVQRCTWCSSVGV